MVTTTIWTRGMSVPVHRYCSVRAARTTDSSDFIYIGDSQSVRVLNFACIVFPSFSWFLFTDMCRFISYEWSPSAVDDLVDGYWWYEAMGT